MDLSRKWIIQPKEKSGSQVSIPDMVVPISNEKKANFKILLKHKAQRIFYFQIVNSPIRKKRDNVILFMNLSTFFFKQTMCLGHETFANH